MKSLFGGYEEKEITERKDFSCLTLRTDDAEIFFSVISFSFQLLMRLFTLLLKLGFLKDAVFEILVVDLYCN